MSDTLVISALQDGEPQLMEGQVEALLDKLDRLVRLRQRPADEKHLALMFWNHPDGERNLSASHLNVPASLAGLSDALQRAGYDVPAKAEAELIAPAQRLLAGYYRPETLDQLYRDGLAESLPLSDYQAWFDRLPEATREALRARWAIRPSIGRCARSTASGVSSCRRCAWASCCDRPSRRVPDGRARPTTTPWCRRTTSTWRSTSTCASVSTPTR